MIERSHDVHEPRAERRPLRGLIHLVGLFSALLGTGAALAGQPPADVVVFHAAADDGIVPGSTPALPPGGSATLHLWMHADDGGATPSSQGTACVSGLGDERCGYDLVLETMGAASFTAFTPNPGIVFHLTSSRLRLNGGDFVSGELGPVKLGDLQIASTGNATVELTDGSVIDARRSGRPLSDDVVVLVPEPTAAASLGTGIVALGLITRARRRRRARMPRPGFGRAVLTGLFGLATVAVATPASAVLWLDGIVVNRIHIVGGTIYYSTPCGGEFLPPSSLASKQSTSWRPTVPVGDQIHYSESCGIDGKASRDVGVANGDVFWLNYGGSVMVERYGSGGVEEAVSSTGSTPAAGLDTIASDGDWVYWSEGSQIYRADVDGGPRTFVEAAPGQVSSLVAFEPGRIAYLAGGRLWRTMWQPVFPSGGFWVTSDMGDASAFAAHEGQLFWADPIEAPGLIRIETWSWAGPSGNVTDLSASGGQIGAMAVNDDYIYYHQVFSASAGISRMNRNGTNAAPITYPVAALDNGQLAATNGHVFWVHTQNQIHRTEADGDPIIENLEALAMEVVQIVQRPENDVRLVAGKATHVRLWGGIESSSRNRSWARPWPLGTVRGYRNGEELPESPLFPVTPFGVDALDPSGPVDRSVAKGQMVFRLPDSWTEPGDLELRGIINERKNLTESTYDDNTKTETLTFHAKSPICTIVVPIDTMLGRYNSYRPRDRKFWERARAIMPTNHLWMHWPGGEPWQEWEGLVRRGVFELSSSDLDAYQLIGRMVASEPFWRRPAACNAAAAKTHLLAIVPPGHPNRFANGLALGNSSILWMDYIDDLSSMSLYDDEPETERVDGYGRAITFAHELGHNNGRLHADCPIGGPDHVDTGYPYSDPCTIGDDPAGAEMGFEPWTLSPLVSDATGDLMSYAHQLDPEIPRWPSAYTWEAIFDDIATPPIALPSPAMAAMAASAASAAAPMQVSGLLDPQSPVAIMHPAIPLDAAAATRFGELYGPMTPDPNLRLRVYDAAGGLIEENPVIVMSGEDGPLVAPAHFISFTSGVAEHARIELVDTTASGPALGVLNGGAAAPMVTIDAPLPGAVVGAPLTIAWTASDADGDTLTSNVRFSSDLGATWRPVVWQSFDTTATMSTEGIPTCTATCLVEVTVSDGARATTVVSAPFSTLSDPLRVTIALDRLGEAGIGRRLVIAQAETAILEGYAYSDDDGPLQGAALQWTVTGPETRAGTGTELRLAGLVPGTYTVTLDATDSLNESGSDSTTLVVEPKRVTDGSAPELDGFCEDLAYQADDDPIRFRYFSTIDASHDVHVQMVHSIDTTYVCMSGLHRSWTGGGLAGIAVDLNESGGATPQPGDLEFRVGIDGVASYAVGTGAAAFDLRPVPSGFEAAAGVNDAGWNAEFAIPDTLLGGFSGRIRAQLFQRYAFYPGFFTQASWPPDSSQEVPDDFGAIELGTPARIVIDADALRDPNRIDPNDTDALHVIGIYSTTSFDAVYDVDYATTAFGPGGAVATGGNAVDLNGDELVDAVLAFDVGDIAATEDDVELCLTGQLTASGGGGPFVACDDVWVGCAADECDFDGDGAADASDGCPVLADDGTDSGGLLTTTPDGIPDACQCGDWAPDGILDASDIDAIRAWLAETPGSSIPAETCDVNDDGACDLVDVAVMSQAQAGLGVAIGDGCAANQAD